MGEHDPGASYRCRAAGACLTGMSRVRGTPGAIAGGRRYSDRGHRNSSVSAIVAGDEPAKSCGHPKSLGENFRPARR